MYDVEDSRGVPVSAGIPPLVRWSTIGIIVLVFIVLGMVVFASRYGHVWPSADSMRLKLS